MPIAINGSGTVTGVSVGGLPDGIVDTDMIAASAVSFAKSSGRKIVNVNTVNSDTDITTSSDGNAASGLSVTWTPKSASNRVIAMVQGGAQQGANGNTRGVTSLYMNVGDGNGLTFYGYMGCFQHDTAFYVPHSGYFETSLANWPGSGTVTAALYMREQGGNATYTLHDNEGGLSDKIFWTVMEI